MAITTTWVNWDRGRLVHHDEVVVHTDHLNLLARHGHLAPMHNVCKEVVVTQLIVNVHLFIVDRESASIYASLILMLWMSSKFSRENFYYSLSNPSSLGEGGEGEVVGPNFSQPVLHEVAGFIVSLV